MRGMRSLVYLNLAINRIEHVEGLETCESLVKLDLTLNAIYDYRDFKSLSRLERLRELHIIGNPCLDHEMCRNYIIATLPHLEQLDDLAVTRTVRIQAQEAVDEKRQEIENAVFERKHEPWDDGSDNSDYVDNCANVRLNNAAAKTAEEYAEQHRRVRGPHTKGERGENGPRQWNTLKFPYTLEWSSEKQQILFILNLPQYLSSDFVRVEVEEDYVFVAVKDNSVQIRLDHHVNASLARVHRITTTGQLKVYMPVLESTPILESEATHPVRHNTSADAPQAQEQISPAI